MFKLHLPVSKSPARSQKPSLARENRQQGEASGMWLVILNAATKTAAFCNKLWTAGETSFGNGQREVLQITTCTDRFCKNLGWLATTLHSNARSGQITINK